MDFRTHESGFSDAQHTRVDNLPLLTKLQAKNGRKSTLDGVLRFLGLLWLEHADYLSVMQEARVLQKSTWDIPRGRV